MSLLVRFGRKYAGERLVEDLLQLVASSHCVGLSFLADLFQAHHLLHIHCQIRDGVAAGLLDIANLWKVGGAVLPVVILLNIQVMVMLWSG